MDLDQFTPDLKSGDVLLLMGNTDASRQMMRILRKGETEEARWIQASVVLRCLSTNRLMVFESTSVACCPPY